jgi:integral membrane sensor domain MASE1
MFVTGLTTFVAWLAAAALSHRLGDTFSQGTVAWLASGVCFGALLVAKPAKRWAVVLGALGAAVALHGFDRLPLLPAVGWALVNVLACAVGAWIAQRFRASTAGAELSVKAYGGFVLGALVAAALGAAGATAVLLLSHAQPTAGSPWANWLSSHFVGILLVAPLVLSFAGFRLKRSGGMPMLRFAGGALAYLLFFITAALIFSSSVAERFGASWGQTLTYVPLPFIVVTAILWKERGATLATLLAALAVIRWTMQGGGPFAAAEAFVGESAIEVQGYVAVIALLVGLVTSLGASLEQALARAREWQTRHHQVLASNRTAVVSFDARSGVAQWDESATALLGPTASALRTMDDWIERAPAAAQAALRADWLSLTQGQRPHARWQHVLSGPGGAGIEVDARLSTAEGADGEVELIVALVQTLAPKPASGE